MSAQDPTNGGLFPEDDPQWDVATDGSGISHAVNRPMPDDRPVSSEERLPEVRDVLAAAAIMVGTLLDAYPEKREWVEGCVRQQAGAFPGADVLQRASEAILSEVDEPLSVVRKIDAALSTPEQDARLRVAKWLGHAHPTNVVAPSPREEAVEAAAKALAHEFAYEWVFEDDPQPSSRDADYWRHAARKMIDAHDVALSAARPSSPTPEETREPFVRELEAFLYSYDARDVTGSFGFTTKEGDKFRERLIAAAPSTTDPAATTKEGR